MTLAGLAFNRYLGVAVGEHLGYLFIGAWTTLIGVALTQTAAAPAWIGAIGIVIGPLLMLCALEFVVRAAGMEGGRAAHPHRLRRVVRVADRHRRRADRLTRRRPR